MSRLSERTLTSAPTGDARARPSLAGLAREHWPLVAALGVVLLIGLPTLNFPYGPDQALFAYIGDQLAHGKTLYVDVWDVKPPGIFWLYALATRLPGEFRGVRAFDMLWTLATVAAVYALGRHLWGRAAGALAGGLYGMAYATASGYWNMAQPDSFMVLPVMIGVLMWDREPRGAAGRGTFMAGRLFGFAFQFRPVVALLPAALAARDLLGATDRKVAARRVVLMIGGAAAVVAATVLYLAVGGALDEYLYAQFRFAGQYARLGGPYSWDALTPGNFLSGMRGSLMWFAASRLLLSAPALAAVFVGGALRADRGVRLVSLLLSVAVATVVIQAKFFVYHWHLAVPFAALLAAWTFREVWHELRARFARAGATALAAAGVGGLLFFTPQITDPWLGEWRDSAHYLRDPAYRQIYIDRFGLRGHGAYSYKASEEVASYIRARTRPADTLFVWGYDPNLYLSAGRESASRFLSLLPLMPTFAPESWKQEFVRDLETRRPAYILVQRGENARWITGWPDDSAEWVPRFAAFQELLTRDYVFDQRIEDYFVYRLR